VPVSALSADVAIDVDWVRHFGNDESPAFLGIDCWSELPLLLAILAVEKKNISLGRFVVFSDVDRSSELIKFLEQVGAGEVLRFPLRLELSRNADSLGEVAFRKAGLDLGVSDLRCFWWRSSNRHVSPSLKFRRNGSLL